MQNPVSRKPPAVPGFWEPFPATCCYHKKHKMLGIVQSIGGIRLWSSHLGHDEFCIPPSITASGRTGRRASLRLKERGESKAESNHGVPKSYGVLGRQTADQE